MKIKRILVSQPEPQNGKTPFHELAQKNNLTIDFKPFIEVEGVSAKDFRQCRIDILDHTAVIFTSRTAIDHFFRICEETRVSIPDVMKYLCISESIAFYLQKYIVYRKRKIFYANGTWGDLHDLIVKHKNETFFVPLSDKHKPEIPQSLNKSKIKWTKAILYRTVCRDLSEVKLVNYDVLVFFSPSGIRSLLQNFPDFEQNNIKIASFGKSTAKEVRKAGLRLDIEAPKPETPSMTMALNEYIQNHNKTNDN